MSEIPRGAIRFNTDSNKPELWDGSQWAEFQLSTPNLGTNLTPTGSVLFSGATKNRLTIPTSSDFAFGTGDFTIEMFVYHTNITGQQTYFGDTYGNTSGIYTYKTDTNQISLYDNAQRSLSATNVIVANKWYHVAWARASGTLRAFLDGIELDSDSYSGNFTTQDYFLGDTASTSSGEFIGHMSNVRITKGQALYTANFAVPTEPLTTTSQGATASNVKLLCCQSTTSETAAAVTPGTLVATSASASNFSPFTNDAQPGPRGLFGGGNSTPNNEIKNIDYINLSSGGTALNFGDLQQTRQALASFGSSTRGFWAGGRDAPTNYDIIEFVTFSSLGDNTDFGNLNSVRQGPFGLSNSTRGIVGGGYNLTTIDYVTMSSTGNAQDFGDVDTSLSGVYQTGIMSPTRGVFNRSLDGSPLAGRKEISFVTIATLGDAIQFGDLQTARAAPGASSNPVRGIFFGGYSPDTSSMEHINMASMGNGVDFGDLLRDTKYNVGNCATPTRGFCAGGSPYTADIQQIDLTTLGDAVKFGDLSSAARYKAGISNAHGGL